MSGPRPPTLRAIREALANASAPQLPPPPRVFDRASVALVFAGPPAALSLCFIRRALREGDRWSGQMAFPGGRASEHDAGPEAVARRETREEVGLDLDPSQCLGRLAEQSLSPTGAQGVLSPFAYYAGEALPRLELEVAEVAEASWIELAYLWSETARTTMPWEHQGTRMRFPGIAHGEAVIWGLTHRVLANLAQRVGSPLPGY